MLLYEVQRIFLPQDVPAPPALTGAPPKCGSRLERTPHWARPGWVATRLPHGLGEDLRYPRSPGHPSEPKQALITRVHYWGDMVTLGQNQEDDFLGPR